ncbi:MAG TPA: TlpA disulfide reductase family protein [Acidobacteriota bacterium]|nr:TlpA disulfide reductase family protein [Acidobacteriota bacterium]
MKSTRFSAPAPALPTLLCMILLGMIPGEFAQASKARFVDFQSGDRRTSDHLKGKITVLNFWATWCAPCVEEMPLLVAIQDAYRDRGVQVVAVSVDEENTRKRIPEFIERFEMNFPVWIEGTIRDMASFELPGVVPSTVVLDQEGRLVGRIVGKFQPGEIETYLDWLLARPPELIENLDAPDGEASGRNGGYGREPDCEDYDDHHHGEEHRHLSVGLESASSVPS